MTGRARAVWVTSNGVTWAFAMTLSLWRGPSARLLDFFHFHPSIIWNNLAYKIWNAGAILHNTKSIAWIGFSKWSHTIKDYVCTGSNTKTNPFLKSDKSRTVCCKMGKIILTVQKCSDFIFALSLVEQGSNLTLSAGAICISPCLLCHIWFDLKKETHKYKSRSLIRGWMKF